MENKSEDAHLEAEVIQKDGTDRLITKVKTPGIMRYFIAIILFIGISVALYLLFYIPMMMVMWGLAGGDAPYVESVFNIILGSLLLPLYVSIVSAISALLPMIFMNIYYDDNSGFRFYKTLMLWIIGGCLFVFALSMILSFLN